MATSIGVLALAVRPRGERRLGCGAGLAVGVALGVIGGVAVAVASWPRPAVSVESSVSVGPSVVVVQTAPMPVAPVRSAPPALPPLDVRPIDDAALHRLVVDLGTTPFPASQLARLRARAPSYTFTPRQAARVLRCFTFDQDRLTALEILRPQLSAGDRAPILEQFDGPFGADRDARLVLGG